MLLSSSISILPQIIFETTILVRNLKLKSQTYNNNSNNNNRNSNNNNNGNSNIDNNNNNNNNNDNNDNNHSNIKEDNNDDAFIDGGAHFVSKTALSLWGIYCKIRKSGT